MLPNSETLLTPDGHEGSTVHKNREAAVKKGLERF